MRRGKGGFLIPKGEHLFNNSKNLPQQGSGKNKEALTKLLPLMMDENRFPKMDVRNCTAEEIAGRITEYLTYCREIDMKPGIEGLCLAIGTTRGGFFQWVKGVYRPDLTDIAQRAKQLMAALYEHYSTSGQINPATSCFLMKNWFGYKDTVNNEVEIKVDQFGERLSNEEIEKLIE